MTSINPTVFLIIVWLFVLGLQCVQALAIPGSIGLDPKLLRRDPNDSPGMSMHAAHGLAIGLIVLAMVVGLAFFFRRSRTWCLQHSRSAQDKPDVNLPAFLRNRPTAGAIPIVVSPRTFAIVSQNPAAYATPPSTHHVPHYITNFHNVPPPVAPPPAYSAAGSQRA